MLALKGPKRGPRASKKALRGPQELPKRVQDSKNASKPGPQGDLKIEKKSIRIALGWPWVAQGVPGTPRPPKSFQIGASEVSK